MRQGRGNVNKSCLRWGSWFSHLPLTHHRWTFPTQPLLAPTAPPTQRQHGPLSHEHQQPRSACSARQLGQAKRWGEGQVFARTGNRCLQVSSLDYGPIGSYQHLGGGSLKSRDGRQILSVNFCGLHFATKTTLGPHRGWVGCARFRQIGSKKTGLPFGS